MTSGYLRRLADRAVGSAAPGALRPRVPSLFEPVAAGSWSAPEQRWAAMAAEAAGDPRPAVPPGLDSPGFGADGDRAVPPSTSDVGTTEDGPPVGVWREGPAEVRSTAGPARGRPERDRSGPPGSTAESTRSHAGPVAAVPARAVLAAGISAPDPPRGGSTVVGSRSDGPRGHLMRAEPGQPGQPSQPDQPGQPGQIAAAAAGSAPDHTAAGSGAPTAPAVPPPAEPDALPRAPRTPASPVPAHGSTAAPARLASLSRPQSTSRRAAPSQEPTVVRVSIGRIEVHATAPVQPATPPPAPEPPEPPLSLESYLRERVAR
jgi:hypothetical protein